MADTEVEPSTDDLVPDVDVAGLLRGDRELSLDGLLSVRALHPPSGPGGRSRVGRYEVERILGIGGMGIVLMVRDPDDGGAWAVKMLRPELAADPESVRLFLREARHMLRLRHANIVAVREVEEGPGVPHYVMPYFPRGPLSNAVGPGRPLEGPSALAIARQVAAALAFAHGRGLVHRDLKPANILLGEDGRALLADFGLARSLANDSMLDVSRDIRVGTAPYMAPEVASGRVGDAFCDIYGLGAILREMLTGEPPYHGRDAVEVVCKVAAGPPPPILEVRPGAHPGLARIAETAMARAKRDRYAEMTDLLADLDRVARGDQAIGPRNGHPGRANPRLRLGRRARPILAAVGVLALSGLMALAWTRERRSAAHTPSPAPEVTVVEALEVAHFRREVDLAAGAPRTTALGLIGFNSFAAWAESDDVRVSARFDSPSYAYLIALNPDGSNTLCHPASAGLAPGPSAIVSYPADPSQGYGLTDGAGLQAFVLVASRRPLPPYQDWLARGGALPWAATSAGPGWRFDGRRFAPLAGERGEVRPLEGLPGPLAATCQDVRNRPGVEAVRVLAFPVLAGPSSSPPHPR